MLHNHGLMVHSTYIVGWGVVGWIGISGLLRVY